MTKQKNVWDAVDQYKYAILYYVYFATCLIVALLLARPNEILASIL